MVEADGLANAERNWGDDPLNEWTRLNEREVAPEDHGYLLLEFCMVSRSLGMPRVRFGVDGEINFTLVMSWRPNTIQQRSLALSMVKLFATPMDEEYSYGIQRGWAVGEDPEFNAIHASF